MDALSTEGQGTPGLSGKRTGAAKATAIGHVSIPEVPMVLTPHSPTYPDHMHIVSGLEMLWQWRAKRTRQELLAAVGARRALVCLHLGLENWNVAVLREKYKGAQRRVGRELLLCSNAYSDALSGAVEAAFLHGCKKALAEVKSIMSGGVHNAAAAAPGTKPKGTTIAVKPAKMTLEDSNHAAQGAAGKGADAAVLAAANVLKRRIADVYRELDTGILQLGNLVSRWPWHVIFLWRPCCSACGSHSRCAVVGVLCPGAAIRAVCAQ